MTTPIWQAGTIYMPGSLVQPLSAVGPHASPLTNGDFEAGNSGWTNGTGFTIGQYGSITHFDGTYSLQYDHTENGVEYFSTNGNEVDVTPGTVINASCQVQQGGSSSGHAGAQVQIVWYDGTANVISVSKGNYVISGSGGAWHQSAVVATAPALAATAKYRVAAFRNDGAYPLWVDACLWDAQVSGLPAGLVFHAVQAASGTSGTLEPVWPVVNGQTVVDNTVTWEAGYASRVVWEASPIMKSGGSEPDFFAVEDSSTSDNTVIWKAMSRRITDAKCPQTAVVAIGASKIFAADDDIVAFSATTNPLDWSTGQDAGFLPFGLQTHGSTPCTALGLYRGNLVAFNSEGFQMWQIDEDPANMALLDTAPVDCPYPRSIQPVSNDLVFLSALGIRSIGIAGASASLQAGVFGKPVDPLVLEAIAEGEVPRALFWPGAGQYWLFFGAEAFVLTMNGGVKDASWSRYVFPYNIDDWAILGTQLCLRAGDIVWRVDPEALQDDVYQPAYRLLEDGDYRGMESSAETLRLLEQATWQLL